MQIAVIVTTSPGREANLQACLQLLAQQSQPAQQILVIDDGSAGGGAICERFPQLPLSYHWRPNDCRVAYSRQLGAEQTTAELLVFLDSDMLLNPKGLAAYAEYLEVFPQHALYGYFGYQQGFVAPSYWLPERQVLWCDRRFERYAPEGLEPASNMLRYPHEWAWSGNLALRRELYFAVGGFDPRFKGWGGEDLDFAWRLRQAGTPLHFFLDAWAEQQLHSRDEAFYQVPESEKTVNYHSQYQQADYKVQVLYSEAGWARLRQAIFGHYSHYPVTYPDPDEA